MSAIERLIDEANPIFDPRHEFNDADMQTLLTLTLDRNATMDAKELTQPVHKDDKPTNRWWIAAVAFAAVVIAVGAAILLIPNTNDSPPATTLNQSVSTLPPTDVSTTAPSSTTTTEPEARALTAVELSFIDDYEAAFNSGDPEQYRAMFAPNALRQMTGWADLDVSVDRAVSEMVNFHAQETVMTLSECAPDNGRVSCLVTLSGPVHDALGTGSLFWTDRFTLGDDGKILGHSQSILQHTTDVDLIEMYEGFRAWMAAEHPDAAANMTTEADRGLNQLMAYDDAPIYLEWAPIWADLGRPTT